MTSLQCNKRKVKLFERAMQFANWLSRLPNKMVPVPFRVLQIGSAFWQSRALYVATELSIADAIGAEQKTSEEIAKELNLNADYLYRLLRMLASIGVFEEIYNKCFRNNNLSNCLRKTHPQSVRDMVLLHNSAEMSRPWFETLGPAIRNGEVPFVQTHGENLFDYMNHHSDFDAMFTGAMESVEALTGIDYLHDFDWSQFDRLIDIGGSNGKKALEILKQSKRLKALVFDRSQVINNAIDYWTDKEEVKLLSRLKFESGDMFDIIPTAGSSKDIYLFVAIFHALNDQQSTQVLKNLRTACGDKHPTIAIMDTVAQEQNIDPTTASFDMQMLIGTNGRERTQNEWLQLLNNNGFKMKEIVNVRTFASIIVAEIK